VGVGGGEGAGSCERGLAHQEYKEEKKETHSFTSVWATSASDSALEPARVDV
jgi:hypothetical protein